MRVRHRVPSIFSLSMVDVLCCALGCIILLWLLNAKQNDDDVEERSKEIFLLRKSANDDRSRNESLLASANKEQAKLLAELSALLGERDKAIALQTRLEDRIKELTTGRSALSARLAAEQKKAKDLAAQLKTSASRVRSLEADVK